MINYNDYLKSFTWKAIKKTKLEQNPICECCNSKKATTVHHLSYERLGHEKEDDIVSICDECHYECHHVNNYQIKNEGSLLRKRFEELQTPINYQPEKIESEFISFQIPEFYMDENIRVGKGYSNGTYRNYLNENEWKEKKRWTEQNYRDISHITKQFRFLKENNSYDTMGSDDMLGQCLYRFLSCKSSPYDQYEKYFDPPTLHRVEINSDGDDYEAYIDRYGIYFFSATDEGNAFGNLYQALNYFLIPNMQECEILKYSIFHDTKSIYFLDTGDYFDRSLNLYRLPGLSSFSIQLTLDRFLISGKYGYDLYSRTLQNLRIPNIEDFQTVNLDEKFTKLKINYFENNWEYINDGWEGPESFEECGVESFAVNESNSWGGENIQIQSKDIQELADYCGLSIIGNKIICFRINESSTSNGDNDFENDGRYYDVYDSGPEFTYEKFYKIHELPEDYTQNNYIIGVTGLEEDEQGYLLHYSLYDSSKYYYEQGKKEHDPTYSHKMSPTCLIFKKTYLKDLGIDIESFRILSPNYVADKNNLYYIEDSIIFSIAHYNEAVRFEILKENQR